jgi:putative transcriptional regulator
MRAPFKAVSEDEDRERKMLTGHSDFTRTAEKRARIMSSVGQVTRTRSVYVVDQARQDAVKGTALIEREEFDRIDDPEELENLIRERAGVEEPA